MNCGENLRALLAPLGVYRWEGSFQWGELQSEGQALDGVGEELAHLQREMNLTTAQDSGLTAVAELLGLAPAAEGEELRQALAALLRVDQGSFTRQAMNDTLRGCGLAAQVEETGDPMRLQVSFPGTRGVPQDFAKMAEVIQGILPCHLQVDYVFRSTTWTEIEEHFPTWEVLERECATWETMEGQTFDA